ncbi:hypothetical protein J6590_034253 [Homalodisca vitripennis]|nr:hypothetical protein J6590_034253 [Homalodisca vitripennis]
MRLCSVGYTVLLRWVNTLPQRFGLQHPADQSGGCEWTLRWPRTRRKEQVLSASGGERSSRLISHRNSRSSPHQECQPLLRKTEQAVVFMKSLWSSSALDSGVISFPEEKKWFFRETKRKVSKSSVGSTLFVVDIECR